MVCPHLMIVHGLYFAPGAADCSQIGSRRSEAFERYAEDLGIRSYQWIEKRGKAVANRMLQAVRGTAPAVDAVEIIEAAEDTLCNALVQQAALWHSIAGCEPYGLDVGRSFLLAGAPHIRLEGATRGPRILWFGQGLRHLSDAEFYRALYRSHGPLVASYAKQLGLKHYRQLPNERADLCVALRELGLGQATPPAVLPSWDWAYRRQR